MCVIVRHSSGKLLPRRSLTGEQADKEEEKEQLDTNIKNSPAEEKGLRELDTNRDSPAERNWILTETHKQREKSNGK